ncbi:hypothetical protein [Myroides pelagicus]|uniref:Uncharacterized protein n=1 Tax=Myroides pelagicus TaxID=270914 RepID=A0A7K1GK62_9FLAO|nr:hypothetical protein [Myroides pelagicus]MEC4114722.1 hypothetical protein [Myroides pelagicus]MTH29275.1 hypothetical protein [Myroides pelagicus]
MFKKSTILFILLTTGVSAQEITQTSTLKSQVNIAFKDNTPYQGVLQTMQGSYKVKTNYDENGYKLDVHYYTEESNQLVASIMYLINNYVSKKIYYSDITPYASYKVKDGVLEDQYTLYENEEVKYEATFDKGVLIEGTVALKDIGILPNYIGQRNNRETYTVLSLDKKTLKIVIKDSQTDEIVYQEKTKIKKNKEFINAINTKLITPSNLYPDHPINHWDNRQDEKPLLKSDL